MAKFISPDSGREVEVPAGDRQDRLVAAGWKRKDGREPNKGQTKKAARPAKPASPASPASPTEPEAPPANPAEPTTTTAAAPPAEGEPEALTQAGPLPEDLPPSGAAPTDKDN